jgi:hypothetical protein
MIHSIMAKKSIPEFIENYDHRADWFYEGQISTKLVLHLTGLGYKIIRDNSDNPNARGEDIIAVSPEGLSEIIEVKGYPTGYYTKGDYRGKKNKTNPKLQAKHWFSEAMLSCFANHAKHRHAGKFVVALAFPLNARYKELIKKVEDFFTDKNIPFKVYFVAENGEVTIDNFCIHHRD